MCYLKFHKCRFCNDEYGCTLPNHHCPTINGDRDKDMCSNCKKGLEERIQKYEFDIAVISLEEIMEHPL